MNGYVKVPREFFEHKSYTQTDGEPIPEFKARLDILKFANYKDGQLADGRIIKRGQLARSKVSLAAEWNWSEARVTRLLKRMKNEGIISYSNVSKCVGKDVGKGISRRVKVVTICNYECLHGNTSTVLSDNVDKTLVEPNAEYTTNKEKEKEERASVKKKDEKIPFYAANSNELQLADFCIEKIKSNHPTVKFTSDKKQQFADMFEKMVRIDKMSIGKIKTMIVWVTSHRDLKTDFSWANQFMSPLKMRKRNRDGIRFTDMWESAMSRSKGSLDGRPANMTAVQWDRIRDMPPCDNCETKEYMKIMSKSGRMSKWYCQKCNTAKTVQR